VASHVCTHLCFQRDSLNEHPMHGNACPYGKNWGVLLKQGVLTPPPNWGVDNTLLKPQSNGPLYSNTVIGTLAVDRWAVTFGTRRKGWYPRCPRISCQCTNFLLFDVTL